MRQNIRVKVNKQPSQQVFLATEVGSFQITGYVSYDEASEALNKLQGYMRKHRIGNKYR